MCGSVENPDFWVRQFFFVENPDFWICQDVIFCRKSRFSGMSKRVSFVENQDSWVCQNVFFC